MSPEKFAPNWASKNTRNRLLNVEKFANDYFFRLQPRRIKEDEERRPYFGQIQNKLSAYFIDSLLFVTDAHVKNLRSTEYHFSWNNLLWSFLQSGLVTEQEVEEVIGKKYLPIKRTEKRESLCLLVFPEDRRAKYFFDLRFFTANNPHLLTENAEYVEDESTTRLLSPFQNKPKSIKARFFAGWWDCDINACAYTLLHQHLINTVLPWWGKHDLEFKVLPLAYTNRDLFRQTLADQLNLDVPTVKEILATIMFDCKLSNNPFSGINKMLVKKGYNPDEFHLLAKDCVLLQGLIAELRKAWPKLMSYWQNSNDKSARKIYYSESINKETGEIRKRFKVASFRARIYFELERKVMNVIRNQYQGKVCHLMHDGFITQEEPDLDLIQSLIEQETGFKVQFSANLF